MQTKQILIRKLINATAYVAPFFSARLSYQIWTSTHRHKMPDKELAVFASAVKTKIQVDGVSIMTYAWQTNQNRPVVLLLHGWNGRGTQLSSFVTRLVKEGYAVVAFDARGHGLSEGSHTSIMETVAIIKTLSRFYGGFFAMIGHSFGMMAAVNAIKNGVACEKVVGISPPTEFSALLLFFCTHLKLNQKARIVLEKYVLAKYKIESFDQISITGLAPEMHIPCLIIHDKNDDKVPLSQSQKAVSLWGKNGNFISKNGLKESGAKLHITEGLGHVRILYKPPVIKAAVVFLRGELTDT